MAEETNMKNALAVYNTLLETLQLLELKFVRHDEDMVITFSMVGEDIPMDILVCVDAERELLRVVSPMPVVFPEEMRAKAAIVTGMINFKLADGSFDLNYSNGKVNFRMTSSYKESLISKDVILYLLHYSIKVIDFYNDKFLLLSKGHIKVEDFLDE